MKKIISVVFFIAAFGLVGCSTQDDYSAIKGHATAASHNKTKCSHKGHRGGKFGAEDAGCDMSK